MRGATEKTNCVLTIVRIVEQRWMRRQSMDVREKIEDYIKYDRLAQLIVEADGPESTIASYDGVEREETVDGQTYYIYRVN